MSNTICELKDRLKQAMMQTNIRPIELSEKTKIPKSSISQYMSGYSKPNGERIYLISRALNVNEAWLMGFDVPMERGDREEDHKPFHTVTLTSDETKLLTDYRELNLEGKEKALEYTSDLTTIEKYKT